MTTVSAPSWEDTGRPETERRTRGGPDNSAVADAFEELAELLAIRGENPFRVRAYQRAAYLIRSQRRPLRELRADPGLAELPGIGPVMAGKIEEYLDTGSIGTLELLRRQVPAGLRELLRVPTLGPVRVRALHAERGIRDLAGLKAALLAGRLAGLRGFGPRTLARLEAALS